MTDLYKNFPLGVLAVALTFGAFGAGVYGAVSLDPRSLSASVAAEDLPPVRVVLAEDALAAKSAVILDTRTNRVLYQKNANEQLPLASITKLMAIQTVLKYSTSDTDVTVTAKAVRTEGDSGLKAGQVVKLGDLITLALVASSNDAVEAALGSLGEEGIRLMNETAKESGLTQSHFFNASGLDVTDTTSGGYASAFDTARLAAMFYAQHPKFFELTTRAEVSVDQSGTEITAAATTVPLQSIPGFVAAKTGYTDLAGGNLVAVFDLQPGLTVVAVAMGSTREGRFEDVKKMIEAARAAL
jgi:D-alanyl-D-alanine carboxypeptidase